MKKKSKIDTKILSDKEVKITSDSVKNLLGDRILEYAQQLGIKLEDTIRFHAVSAKCKERRESKKLNLKEIGHKLKVPQYKLRYIENGSVRNIEVEILYKYINFLGLSEWFQQWLKSNPKFESKFQK